MQGLTTEDANRLLSEVGRNEINEKQQNALIALLKWFSKPTSIMIEVAFVFSLIAGRMADAYVVLGLLFINVFISFYHEHMAENALRKLQEKLAITCKVIRDGKETRLDSSLIVPGDVILLEKGDVVPADCSILESIDLTVDESLLTGESFPKDKKKDDSAYSTSIIKKGKATCLVSKTGKATYFGNTIKLITKSDKESMLEKDVLKIAKFLIAAGLLAMIILSGYLLFLGKSALDILELDVSIAIASFPISLPTVMTLVTSLGAYNLSKKNVIIRRLAALDDLSQVSLLLTDKTGTITKNEITVDSVISYDGDKTHVTRLAYACSDPESDDIIDRVITSYAESINVARDFTVISYKPASSETKKAKALVKIDGRKMEILKGASQVILKDCKLNKLEKQAIENDIEKYSAQGYKIIAVAYKQPLYYKFAGLLLLMDPARDDAKETIAYMKENGIDVKIVTGDNEYIAKKVGQDVGVGGRVALRDQTNVNDYDVFSELLPEDKYNLVKEGRKGNVVAVTGDGVNDIPALKAANVGIAVNKATDAAKSSADVYLLTDGIAVIKDALLESREIFERVYYYSVYRISESFRVILTILIIGLLMGTYPLAPIQLILLALLNDIPIITIAFDKVKPSSKPTHIDFNKRTKRSVLFGLVGVINSILFLFLALTMHFTTAQIQTLFFLKLSIGGHLLLLVARAKGRWYRDMPSKILLAAIVTTQLVASLMAFTGFLMPAVPINMIVFIWIYALAWMQVSDLTKGFEKNKVLKR